MTAQTLADDKHEHPTQVRTEAAGAVGKTFVLLTNFVPPYRVGFFNGLSRFFSDFTVLASTPMEPDRDWEVPETDFPVQTQSSLTLKQNIQHKTAFSQEIFVHIPVDTLTRLIKLRPDIVLTDEFGVRTLLSLVYAKLFGARVFVWATISERTEEVRGPVRTLFRKIVARLSDGVLTNGRSGARYLKKIGFPDERIHIVGQSIDTDHFTPEADAQDRAALNVLAVGNLIPRKGIHGFLHNLATWAERRPDKRISFALLGDGPERDAIEALNVPDNLSVRIVGSVPYLATRDWYRKSDLLLFPTLADEWGLVVNESLACGVPVLGSMHSQAVQEMIVDGENGWTFYPEEPEALFAALDRFCDLSPSQRQQLSENARSTALGFSHEAVAENFRRALLEG